MYPAIIAPCRQWLTGIDAEVIERAVGVPGRELGPSEPGGRKLVLAIGQILPAEDHELQHLARGEFWLTARGKLAASGCLPEVYVIIHIHCSVYDLSRTLVCFTT